MQARHNQSSLYLQFVLFYTIDFKFNLISVLNQSSFHDNAKTVLFDAITVTTKRQFTFQQEN